MAATILMIRYDADSLEETQLSSLDGIAERLQQPGVHWLHVQGEVETEQLHQLAEIFHLHPLAVEDVLGHPQRPKAEEYEANDFVIAHSIQEAHHSFIFQQFSMFGGENYVLSFQQEGDVAEQVRQRLQAGRGLIRQHGVDHLMYALLDTIIDGYFPVLERVGEQLDRLHEQALWQTNGHIVSIIQHAKRELRHLRRMLFPLRELLNVLMRDDNDSISPPVREYLRDAYDHVIQLMDMVEIYREMSGDLMDAYLSAVSNRMNSIMKVLTIIATVFMPLTFIVGVYGMNFRWDVSRWNMPELSWRYGYVFVWGVMIATVIVMLAYFRKAGWIGKPDLPVQDKRGPNSRRR